MDLNIPKSSTVSHELPIFTELSRDSGIPVSEIKARFRNEMLEKHKEAMDDPSNQVLGGTEQDMVHDAVNSLRQKLEHPEEQSDEDTEYDDLLGFDPNVPPPGADMFAAPDDFGGDTGSFGGGFGGGIDNMDLGFSDEGMASFDQVNDDFGDFGSELDGDSVNAMSEIEPGSPDTETEPLDNGGSDEGPAEDFDLGGSDDLAEL